MLNRGDIKVYFAAHLLCCFGAQILTYAKYAAVLRAKTPCI